MELREWDICESLSSILSVQSPKGWRPPFLSSAASVHRTKSALLFVPIRKSALLFVPVTQSALLFDPVSACSSAPLWRILDFHRRSRTPSFARRRNRAAPIRQHDSELSGPRWAGPGPLSRMSCSAWAAMAYLSPLPPEAARRSLAL